MSKAYASGCVGGAIRSEAGHAIVRGAAAWLHLAATPIFAAMALLTGVLGGGQPDVLCSGDASPLTGMIPMYLLMSAFHLPPWLRLLSTRRRARA